MSPDPAVAGLYSWRAAVIGVTAVIAVASAAVGFVWLPSSQGTDRIAGVWYAICSAAGLVRFAPDTAMPVQAAYRTTDVVVTPRMLDGGNAMSVGRGATMAMQCTTCHGARGISEANTPNLAGQYSSVIFKQLEDYRSGARTDAIMSPRAKDLSDQDIRDLAAYYAYLPRLPSFRPATAEPVPRIVANGSPTRNIAPCTSCHGDVAYKVGSPWLEGESPVYLRAQLLAFASGARHNDINQQMRNVARGMTQAEIDAAARYYSNQP